MRWLLVCVVAASACGSGEEQVQAIGRQQASEQAEATRSSPPPSAALGTVYLTGAAGEVAVKVEVVDTDATIQRGLMFRTAMAPDAGMLFVPRVEKVWSFWMRNTLIPLDMLFIGRDLTVVGVVENTVPHDESPRSVRGRSLYILEVNAGWAARHGVEKGARVRFDGIAAIEP